MRVTPADTEPSTKPGSKPPQRARRSSAPSLVYPSDRNGAVRMVETTVHAVHIQSTFSPLSVHMWVHIQSTWGSTYVDPRSTSKGVTKGMVERAGGPLCLRSGATRRSAGVCRLPEGRRHARQGRDPIQFLPATLSHTQPYSVHVHVTWNTQSTCNSTYVVPHARGHRGPCGVQRRTE
jgi:hypothetical protein